MLIGVLLTYVTAWGMLWPWQVLDPDEEGPFLLTDELISTSEDIYIDEAELRAEALGAERFVGVGWPLPSLRAEALAVDWYHAMFEFRPAHAFYRRDQYPGMTDAMVQFPYRPQGGSLIGSAFAFAVAWAVVAFCLTQLSRHVHSWRSRRTESPLELCRLRSFRRWCAASSVLFVLMAAAIVVSGLALTPTAPPLIAAVCDGDAARVQRLLDGSTPDLNEVHVSRFRRTNALAVACNQGDPAMVDRLLAAGADPKRIEASLGGGLCGVTLMWPLFEEEPFRLDE